MTYPVDRSSDDVAGGPADAATELIDLSRSRGGATADARSRPSAAVFPHRPASTTRSTAARPPQVTGLHLLQYFLFLKIDYCARSSKKHIQTHTQNLIHCHNLVIEIQHNVVVCNFFYIYRPIFILSSTVSTLMSILDQFRFSFVFFLGLPKIGRNRYTYDSCW